MTRAATVFQLIIRAGYLERRRRLTTATIPTRMTAPGRRATGSHRTSSAWGGESTMGFDLVSRARTEIWFSSSASHETAFRKKSRLPWAPRNWLDARFAVPITTRRAFAGFFAASAASPSFGAVEAAVGGAPGAAAGAGGGASTVATAATGRGPGLSFGSALAPP